MDSRLLNNSDRIKQRIKFYISELRYRNGTIQGYVVDALGFGSTDDIYQLDRVISWALDMDLKEYEQGLMQYGATKTGRIVYFKNKEDAERAIEWADSLLIIREMRQ